MKIFAYFNSQVLTSLAIYLALATFVASSSIAAGEGSLGHYEIPEPIHPLMLQHLGSVDGKNYFVDVNQTMNWVAAKAYCNASSLALASIDTPNQYEFLGRTLKPYGFLFFWTSAHESRPVNMVWDGTSNQPDTTFLARWFWEDVRAYQYCATFSIYGAKLDMDVHKCDTFMARPLCQT